MVIALKTLKLSFWQTRNIISCRRTQDFSSEGGRFRSVATKNFWITLFKLSQMQRDAILEKFSSVFRLISRVIFLKGRGPDTYSPLGYATVKRGYSEKLDLKALL